MKALRQLPMYTACDDGEQVEPTTRPTTWGECDEHAERDERGRIRCPWVGCSMHLAIDVVDGRTLTTPLADRRHKANEMDGGGHHLTRARFDVKVLDYLDVAEWHCAHDAAREQKTLRDVGEMLYLTRERIRQIEAAAMERLMTVRQLDELARLAGLDDKSIHALRLKRNRLEYRCRGQDKRREQRKWGDL